ncbi:MAG TPA: SMP-30/gluconolactonase/LRE family protein [Piscinibacter sp.]|mgnify:FL=1|nr:SMP-30/gluconolactonase/LRE family protein [Piscinibacter sp.]
MDLPAPTLGSVRCVWPAGATLGEGTCWSVREQSLYWVDILEKRLFRHTPATGEQRQWQLDDTISAVAERADGLGLVITLRRGFAFYEPATGTLHRLDEPEPERTANRFNDGKCDAQGRFWGGTMDSACLAPTGALYRFDGPGRCVRAFDAGFAVSNGPTWSLDGRTMFFNDTVRRKVHAFAFDPSSGTLGASREFLRFERGDGFPDGMTTDAAGRLWIAHWGAASVSCHDPDSGAELARVRLPTDHISNVAFGGADLKTLFITSARFELGPGQLAEQPLAGALFAVDTDAAGLPANLFGAGT